MAPPKTNHRRTRAQWPALAAAAFGAHSVLRSGTLGFASPPRVGARQLADSQRQGQQLWAAGTAGWPSLPSRGPLATTDQVTSTGAVVAGCQLAALVASAPLLAQRALACGRAARHRLRTGRRATEEAVAVAEKEAEAEEVREDVPFFEEVSGDDPMVLELEERLKMMNGNKDLTLDMVLNPGTIVNTERQVVLLKAELKATPEEDKEKIKELEDKIEEKQMKIVNEMKQVMTDSLKLEFLSQAFLSVPLFWSFCYGNFPWYPDWGWLELTPEDTKLCFRILGYWGIWLVTVPALRARKPGGPYGMGYEEKRALDLSFLVLPLICILTPFLSKEPAAGFWISLLAVAGLYLWSFNTPLQEEKMTRRGTSTQDEDLPEQVKWLLKALDFGTGSERGVRSEDDEWKSQLDAYEKAAEEMLKAKEEKKLAEKAKKEATKEPAS